jgi:hypothetical protein
VDDRARRVGSHQLRGRRLVGEVARRGLHGRAERLELGDELGDVVRRRAAPADEQQVARAVRRDEVARDGAAQRAGPARHQHRAGVEARRLRSGFRPAVERAQARRERLPAAHRDLRSVGGEADRDLVELIDVDGPERAGVLRARCPEQPGRGGDLGVGPVAGHRRDAPARDDGERASLQPRLSDPRAHERERRGRGPPPRLRQRRDHEGGRVVAVAEGGEQGGEVGTAFGGVDRQVAEDAHARRRRGARHRLPPHDAEVGGGAERAGARRPQPDLGRCEDRAAARVVEPQRSSARRRARRRAASVQHDVSPEERQLEVAAGIDRELERGVEQHRVEREPVAGGRWQPQLGEAAVPRRGERLERRPVDKPEAAQSGVVLIDGDRRAVRRPRRRGRGGGAGAGELAAGVHPPVGVAFHARGDPHRAAVLRRRRVDRHLQLVLGVLGEHQRRLERQLRDRVAADVRPGLEREDHEDGAGDDDLLANAMVGEPGLAVDGQPPRQHPAVLAAHSSADAKTGVAQRVGAGRRARARRDLPVALVLERVGRDVDQLAAAMPRLPVDVEPSTCSAASACSSVSSSSRPSRSVAANTPSSMVSCAIAVSTASGPISRNRVASSARTPSAKRTVSRTWRTQYSAVATSPPAAATTGTLGDRYSTDSATARSSSSIGSISAEWNACETSSHDRFTPRPRRSTPRARRARRRARSTAAR